MDEFEARPKTKKFHKYTLSSLQNIPDGLVSALLNEQLAKRGIHIESLYRVPRHDAVREQLFSVSGHEVYLFGDLECHITHIESGEVVSGGVVQAYERALLIALWRELHAEKKPGRKRLEQYTLDKLLALPAGDVMDDLLNEQFYGFLGGGTCKRSSDYSIVGYNLEKLGELGAFWDWRRTNLDGHAAMEFFVGEEKFFVPTRPIAHCVATALLIAYWCKLKADAEVEDGQ